MKRISIFIFLFSLFIFLPQKLLAASSSSSSTNYDDINFPQWARDLRRTEIITFGSLPFVTLWTTLGYSLYEYGEFRNPLSKNTDSFTEGDVKKIIGISAVTCLGLGLTDLTINLIQRSRKESLLKKQRESQPFTVTGEKEMQKIRMKAEETDEMAEERIRREKEMEKAERPEDFIEGIESVLF